MSVLGAVPYTELSNEELGCALRKALDEASPAWESRYVTLPRLKHIGLLTDGPSLEEAAQAGSIK